MKGTRRLQLRNSMQAKFDKILLPIGELILAAQLDAGQVRQDSPPHR